MEFGPSSNMIYPSIAAHILGGILLCIAFVVLLINYRTVRALNMYQTLVLILFFATVVGIHGLSHLGLERNYNYNPLSIVDVTSNQDMKCPCMNHHRA